MASPFAYMDLVFLVYGLAFLSLGLSVVLLNERDSSLEVSRVLWFLAAFGFIHGLHEWINLWHAVRGDTLALELIQSAVLLASYFLLFEFGRRLVLASQSVGQRTIFSDKILSPWIYVPILLGILVGVAVSDNPNIAMVIWSRYVMGFFGSCLAGTGFHLYCRNRVGANAATSDYPGQSVAWNVAAATFVAYGIFGGLVGPRAEWFPASAVNEARFFSMFGVPVHLLRAGCAIVLAISVGKILRIFRHDHERKLLYAHDLGQCALAELSRIKPRFEAVLDSVKEGILGLDSNCNIIFANDSALLMLGYRRENLIGKPFHALTRSPKHADGNPSSAEDLQVSLAIQNKASYRVDDGRFWRKNRTWFPVEYRSAPLWSGRQIHGAVIAFTNTAETGLNKLCLSESEQDFGKKFSH